MNEKTNQQQVEGQSELKDESLEQVNGGNESIAWGFETSVTCAVPGCPKCSCTMLGYSWDENGQMNYICSSCGYTGSRKEFPYIMPSE